MAEAHTQVEIIKKERVVLALSPEEAECLIALTARVGGPPVGSARELSDRIQDALISANVRRCHGLFAGRVEALQHGDSVRSAWSPNSTS